MFDLFLVAAGRTSSSSPLISIRLVYGALLQIVVVLSCWKKLSLWYSRLVMRGAYRAIAASSNFPVLLPPSSRLLAQLADREMLPWGVGVEDLKTIFSPKVIAADAC